MIDVFIVGSKGIPAQYGGFETFVEHLTGGRKSDEIRYHVSCMNNDEKHFEYNHADCFNVRLPLPGAPGRILHVGRALEQIEHWKIAHPENPTIVYILGCRIGPLLIQHAKRLHILGVTIMCNPDGLEWRRDKWNTVEKWFLKYCEKCLVKNSDHVICDSREIEKYILSKYPEKQGHTGYIAYGADLERSEIESKEFNRWLSSHDLTPGSYYLVVGRFVPENNYEHILRQFIASHTEKSLVIVTNIEQGDFYDHLLETGFDRDKRVKFVGTVYDQPLLKKIRENACAYIHGHEVGGTNPSLLEALSSTRLNLVNGVDFNKEVCADAALYWNRYDQSLSELIDRADKMTEKELEEYGKRAKKEIHDRFTWEFICSEYEKLFLDYLK